VQAAMRTATTDNRPVVGGTLEQELRSKKVTKLLKK